MNVVVDDLAGEYVFVLFSVSDADILEDYRTLGESNRAHPKVLLGRPSVVSRLSFHSAFLSFSSFVLGSSVYDCWRAPWLDLVVLWHDFFVALRVMTEDVPCSRRLCRPRQIRAHQSESTRA